MKEIFGPVLKWIKDERSSILSETSLVTAVAIIGGIALGAIALPKIKTYAETVYVQFEGATTETGFTPQ